MDLKDLTDFKLAGNQAPVTDFAEFTPTQAEAPKVVDFSEFTPVVTSEPVKPKTFGEKVKTAATNIPKAISQGAKQIATGAAVTLEQFPQLLDPRYATPPTAAGMTALKTLPSFEELGGSAEKTTETILKNVAKLPEVTEQGFEKGPMAVAEKTATSLAQSGIPMAAYMVPGAGPLLSVATIYAQLKGAKYDELTKQGIDKETAARSGDIAALMGTPVEFLGNLLQFKGASTAFKAITSKAKIGDKVSQVLYALGMGGAGEGSEELVQAYTDAIATAYGENADKTPKEIAAATWNKVRTSAQFKNALIQGGYGALAGMFIPGIAMTVGAAKNTFTAKVPAPETVTKFKTALRDSIAKDPELTKGLEGYRDTLTKKSDRVFKQAVDEVITEVKKAQVQQLTTVLKTKVDYVNPTLYIKNISTIQREPGATISGETKPAAAGAPKTAEQLGTTTEPSAETSGTLPQTATEYKTAGPQPPVVTEDGGKVTYSKTPAKNVTNKPSGPVYQADWMTKGEIETIGEESFQRKDKALTSRQLSLLSSVEPDGKINSKNVGGRLSSGAKNSEALRELEKLGLVEFHESKLRPDGQDWRGFWITEEGKSYLGQSKQTALGEESFQLKKGDEILPNIEYDGTWEETGIHQFTIKGTGTKADGITFATKDTDPQTVLDAANKKRKEFGIEVTGKELGGPPPSETAAVKPSPLSKVRSTQVEMTNNPDIGGSTFSGKGEDMGGKPYYAVAILPEFGKVYKGLKVTQKQIDDFWATHADALKRYPELNVGTWNDKANGVIHLDLTIAVSKANQDVAISLAKEHNQKAITDLETFDEIKTGGTGDARGFTQSLDDAIWNYRDSIKGQLGGEAYQLKAETTTPEFKKWFKGSKVVDEKDEPLVVYHGTKSKTDFEVFDAKRSDLGFHFGTQLHAHSFVDYGYNSRIIPAYLSLIKPLRLEDYGRWDAAAVIPQLIDRGIISAAEWDRVVVDSEEWSNSKNDAAVRKILKDKGYDGIIYLNRREGLDSSVQSSRYDYISDTEFREVFPEAEDSYIAFSPEQIKSVYNRGTWNPEDARISYQRKPGLPPEALATEFLNRSAAAETEIKSVLKKMNAPEEYSDRLFVQLQAFIDERSNAAQSESEWFDLLGEEGYKQSKIVGSNTPARKDGVAGSLIKLALFAQNPSGYRDTIVHELIETQIRAGALSDSDMTLLNEKFGGNRERITQSATDFFLKTERAKSLPNSIRAVWSRFWNMVEGVFNGIRSSVKGKGWDDRTANDAIRDLVEGKFQGRAAENMAKQDRSQFVTPSEAGYVLAGGKAQGAPTDRLYTAALMDAAKQSKDEIWKSTGWIKGVDGKWRFELDDSQAVLDTSWMGPKAGQTPRGTNLENVLQYTQLFTSYPWLRGLPVNVDIDPTNRLKGSFVKSGSKKGVNISAPTVEEAKAGVFHEVQHAIQEYENFARGASTTMYMDEAAVEISKLFKPKSFKEVEGLVGARAEQMYVNTAGEAEAREVFNRTNMTAEQRAATPPGYDGIAESDLIIRGIDQESYQLRTDSQTVFDDLLKQAKETSKTDEITGKDDIEEIVTKRFAELQEAALTPADNALDKAATEFVKTGDLNAYFDKMPNMGDLNPEDIFKYDPKAQSMIANIIGEDGKIKPAIRKSGFYAVDEYAQAMSKAEDIGDLANMYTDPDRLFEQMDGGKAGGVNQKYILGPSNMNTRARMVWEDQQTGQVHDIVEKYNLSNGKKRKAVGQIIESVTGNNAWAKETDKILELKPVQEALKGFDKDTQIELVNSAFDFRKLLQRWRDNQNHARKLRKQNEIKYIVGYLPAIRESNVWARLLGEQFTAKTLPMMPDFITPNQPFNARAMARKGGLDPMLREWDIVKLLLDYKTTASKDIFDTNTIHNNKIHAAVLENLGLKNSADFVYQWTSEYFAGSPGRLEKALNKVIPKVVTNTASWLKRGITMSAFSMNPAWNLQQLTSVIMTAARYPIKSNLAGLNYFYDKDLHRAIKQYGFSSVIKSRIGGGAYYQDVKDIVESKVKRIDTSFTDTAVKWANLMTSALEDALTGHAIATAYHDGYNRLGLRGRDLWEYASEGGFKTQGAFHKGRLPGLIRAKQVAMFAPFMNFPFEVFNTLRETNIPVVRKFLPATGLYEDIAMDSTKGKALISNRIEIVTKLMMGALVANYITEKLTGVKSWTLSTFIPGIGYLLGGMPIVGKWVNEYNPRSPNYTLVYRAANDLFQGVKNAIEYGSYKKLRKWLFTYGHIPAGLQIEKTTQAIEAISKEGKVTDVSGKTDYTIEPKDFPAALITGPYWAPSAVRQREEATQKSEEKKAAQKAAQKAAEKNPSQDWSLRGSKSKSSSNAWKNY
ncbi:MAG: hypothetical protein EHM41_00050 [Chloroflexi bacterium]|nr:MAG: hypothetical protein EHM41_00050 [Chloroflexota bacterium]